MKNFTSTYHKLGRVIFPKRSQTQVMMLPVLLQDSDSLPDNLQHYKVLLETLIELSPEKEGTAYLTIDEKYLQAGQTHRRLGLHVDGVLENGLPGGWGGGGGCWGDSGMILASNVSGCKVWNKDFVGKPGFDGDCEHLRSQCSGGEVLKANSAYWCSGLCVHESLPMEQACYRSIVRLSMPSDAPWFEGYTRNPKGVEPAGPVLARRVYQSRREVVL